MAISFVGRAAASADTVALPAGWQAGDIAVVHAYRNGSNTLPGNPGGGTWTDIATGNGANTNSRRIGYRVLQSGDNGATIVGTWGNATAIQVVVLRGQKTSGPIGANSSGGTNTSTMTLPALTVVNTDGTGWLIGFGGSKSTNANAMDVSGTTTQSTSGNSIGALGCHTLEGVSGNFSATAYSSTVNANGNRMDTVEILAEPDAPPEPTEENISLGVSSSISQQVQLTVNGSILLSHESGVSDASQQESNHEVNFPLSADLITAGGMTLTDLITLSTTLGLSAAPNISFDDAVILAKGVGLASSMLLYSNLSIQLDTDLSQVNTDNISAGGTISLESSLLLPVGDQLVLQEEFISEVLLGVFPTSSIVSQNFMTLGLILGQSIQGTLTAVEQVTLAIQKALSVEGDDGSGGGLTETIHLSNALSISPALYAAIEGNVNVNLLSSIAVAGAALVQAGFTIDQLLAITASGRLQGGFPSSIHFEIPTVTGGFSAERIQGSIIVELHGSAIIIKRS